MTLKSARKMITETKVNYIVFNKEGEYLEDIKLDYLGERAETTQALEKILLLEQKKAKVKHITVNKATHILEVTVETA